MLSTRQIQGPNGDPFAWSDICHFDETSCVCRILELITLKPFDDNLVFACAVFSGHWNELVTECGVGCDVEWEDATKKHSHLKYGLADCDNVDRCWISVCLGNDCDVIFVHIDIRC